MRTLPGDLRLLVKQGNRRSVWKMPEGRFAVSRIERLSVRDTAKRWVGVPHPAAVS